MSEMLNGGGPKLFAISSGSTGQALFVEPGSAARGKGVLITRLRRRKTHGIPERTSTRRSSPLRLQTSKEETRALEWTERVLREYVTQDLKPDVVFDWLTEPTANSILTAPDHRRAWRASSDSRP